MLSKYSKVKKKKKCAIISSPIWHKNTIGSIRYCVENNLPYELIENSDYHSFLKEMGECESFVFFPQTTETLSRVVVEARMMGLEVFTHPNVGAMSEPWINLKGDALINVMLDKRKSILNKITSAISSSDSSS